MPESIGDIRNSFDAAYHRLSDKMDAEINQLQEIAGKLKDNIAELRTESLKATSSLRDDTFAAVADVRKNIATIDATVKSYDLIFKVAPVVVAVLGAFGVWKLVQSHLDYEQAISESREVNAHAKVLSEQLGTLVRDDLIDKIESALISEASLDALRSRPEVKTQISSLAKQLQVTNQQLPSDQQTTYYQISNAFTHYMANECVPVLQILDQIREADRELVEDWRFQVRRGMVWARSASNGRWQADNDIKCTSDGTTLYSQSYWKRRLDEKFGEHLQVVN
jgi:hypothetical protein